MTFSEDEDADDDVFLLGSDMVLGSNCCILCGLCWFGSDYDSLSISLYFVLLKRKRKQSKLRVFRVGPLINNILIAKQCSEMRRRRCDILCGAPRHHIHLFSFKVHTPTLIWGCKK